jgi:tetratricopeptide (TPR) repeat protein
MEAVILIFFFLIYIVLRVLFAEKSTEERDAARFAEGMELLRKKDWNAAQLYFGKVIQSHNKSAVAWTALGATHFHQGDMLMAQICLDKAIVYDNIASAFLYRGKVAFANQHFPLALIELNKAIWYNRKSAEAYRLKGLTLLQLSKPDEAITAFKDAVKRGDEISNAQLQQMRIPTEKGK